jgi:hypothetical protein
MPLGKDPAQRNEPDWEALQEISKLAERGYRRPGWTLARWKQLHDRALAATNGHGEFTEFLAPFRPTSER